MSQDNGNEMPLAVERVVDALDTLGWSVVADEVFGSDADYWSIEIEQYPLAHGMDLVETLAVRCQDAGDLRAWVREASAVAEGYDVDEELELNLGGRGAPSASEILADVTEAKQLLRHMADELPRVLAGMEPVPFGDDPDRVVIAASYTAHDMELAAHWYGIDARELEQRLTNSRLVMETKDAFFDEMREHIVRIGGQMAREQGRGEVADFEFDEAEEGHFPLEQGGQEDGTAWPELRVRDWYAKTFPTDELGAEIPADVTFGDVYWALLDKGDVYETLGVGDSVVRERAFRALAAHASVSFEDVYEAWDSDDPSARENLENKAVFPTLEGNDGLDEQRAAATFVAERGGDGTPARDECR